MIINVQKTTSAKRDVNILFYYLFILVVIMSLLLVAEIQMFSLKFKSLAWKQNKVSYIFLIVCIPLLIFFKISSFAAIILWYIILSLLTKKRA